MYQGLSRSTYRKTNSPGLGEYSRLIAAAVVSEQFRQKLLQNPSQALAVGYRGEKFNLAKEQRARVVAIHASSLSDFARQLLNEQEV
jgi:hypothetical protein